MLCDPQSKLISDMLVILPFYGEERGLRPRENRVTFPRFPNKLKPDLEILLPWSLSLALMAGVGVHKWVIGVTDMSQIPALPTIYCVTPSKSLTLCFSVFASVLISKCKM